MGGEDGGAARVLPPRSPGGGDARRANWLILDSNFPLLFQNLTHGGSFAEVLALRPTIQIYSHHQNDNDLDYP
jgi:hypothetical protein